MRLRIALALAFAALSVAPLADAAPPPNLRSEGMRLETLLEKTILRVDAAYTVVQLPPILSEQVSARVRGQGCDSATRADLERMLLGADAIDIELTFRHGASLTQLLDGYRANWRRMIRAGMLPHDFDTDKEMKRQRARFAFLQTSGLHDGDRFLYRVRGDTVSMRFVDAQGAERLDETEVGSFPRRSLLAAFFLKGSEFRDGLLRSACR